MWAAESCLRRALEAMLDVGRHVVAKGLGKGVSEYKEIASHLAQAGILSADSAQLIKQTAGYKNRLVHFYHEMSTEKLYTLTVMLHRLITQASRIIVDQEQQITLALTCLLAQGHVLIEDIPGIGKTTLAKSLATLLGLDFQRIQCTSDLLPGDILGVSVFDRSSGEFRFQPGPIFAQMVLVDEINRASPKTQSGLLEAMAEGQVSLDRQSHPLPEPFFVIATQNPLEQSGTSPLPESQLDRFMIRMHLGYPSRQAERNLLLGQNRQDLLSELEPVLDPAKIQDLQARAQEIHTAAPVIDYIQNLLHFTRRDARFQSGLSPRAGLDLVRCAQAWAMLQNRDFVLPEDVQAVLPWVSGHRLRLTEPVSPGSGNEYLMQLFREVHV